MTNSSVTKHCFAFADAERCLAEGELDHVITETMEELARQPSTQILVFEEETGRVIDLDLRGSKDDVLKRMNTAAKANSVGPASESEKGSEAVRGRGRPRLGVVAREVTLLPRHWEWLNAQPGGASVALRKLVEEARHSRAGKDRVRLAQEATYRFMSAVAGDRKYYEESTRALFAGDRERLVSLLEEWPTDIRKRVLTLAEEALR